MTEPRLTTLPSGLRVVSETVPGARTAAVALSVDVGARYERDDQHGVTHLLEHMAFKGTERRTAQGIAEEFDEIGGDLNAWTSMEHTVYHARVLADDLPAAVDMIADILQHSTFDAEELAREQHVIAQEIAMHEDAPEERVFDLFQRAAFADQPLGRSILGTEESVRSHGSADLFDFVREHYGVGRMVLSAAGSLDHDKLVGLAVEHFDALGTTPGTRPQPGAYTGGEWREEDDLEQTHLILGVPGVAYHDPDFYTAQVLSTLLGGGLSSRLFQEVREKRGLAYSVYAFQSGYADTGIFGVYAATAPKDLAELVNVTSGEVLSVASNVTEQEVRRARRQIVAAVLMGRESSGNVSEALGRQLLCYGRVRSTEEIVAKIEAVTPEDISRLMTRLLAGPLTLTALGPQGTLAGYEQVAERLRA